VARVICLETKKKKKKKKRGDIQSPADSNPQRPMLFWVFLPPLSLGGVTSVCTMQTVRLGR
jgi:hypothetical protein